MPFADDDGIVVGGEARMPIVERKRKPQRQRASKKMTLAEYLRTPETLLPTELAYGVLRVADTPTPRHQAAVGDFYVALRNHVDTHLLGHVWLAPIDVILDAERALVVQPDLLFISESRAHIVTERIYGAPDLVIEVLSPNARVGRLDERVAWFAQYGVREAWLVHQVDRRIDVIGFEDGRIGTIRHFDRTADLVSRVLPGFRRSLDSITGW